MGATARAHLGGSGTPRLVSRRAGVTSSRRRSLEVYPAAISKRSPTAGVMSRECRRKRFARSFVSFVGV